MNEADVAENSMDIASAVCARILLMMNIIKLRWVRNFESKT